MTNWGVGLLKAARVVGRVRPHVGVAVGVVAASFATAVGVGVEGWPRR